MTIFKWLDGSMWQSEQFRQTVIRIAAENADQQEAKKENSTNVSAMNQ